MQSQVIASTPELSDATDTDVSTSEATAVLETDFGKEQPVEHVPYSRLRLSPLNVRTKPLSGIAGLADNIAAKGLLQNLVVHFIKGSRSKQPKLGVCAGQRRLAALDLLHRDGRIPADYPVPVRIVSEADAFAASLIENSQRENLDVFDTVLAFKRLADEGRSIGYIAALFDVSPLTVKRRLKLAHVSPKLLALLREDAISIDQLAALALVDDHETQERIWFDAPNDYQRAAHYLRQAITRAEIDASRSRLVKFVGLDAYEAAGGYVRRDLFSDEQNAGYVADADLLQRLVGEKLEAAAEAVRAEGFGWVQTRIERDHSELNSFGRLQPVHRPYTEDEQRELDALKAQHDEIVAKFDALEEGDEKAYEEAENLEAAMDATERAIGTFAQRAQVWDAAQIAQAGAFVTVGPNGELMIDRGLVKLEDFAILEGDGAVVTGLADTDVSDASTGSGKAAPKERPVHSAALCQRLTAHRTAAVQAELTKRPSMALAVLLHRLVPVVFPERYRSGWDASYLELNATSSHDKLLKAADDMPASIAWTAIDAQRQQWTTTLPARRADLLPWLIDQDPGTTLLDLLAFCTASLIDGITGTGAPHTVNALTQVLELDMTRYWTPTRASYFDHVSKARIIDVVASAISPKAAADLEKMKKGDAAAAAELRLAKVKWVPEILTSQAPPVINHYDPDDDEADDGDDGDDGDTQNESPEDDDTGAHANGTDSEPDGSQATAEATTLNGDATGRGADGDDTSAAAPGTTPNGAGPAWPFPTAATASGKPVARA
ncbi:ParB/RepB/Spo0J family partition protein [Caballeronia sp. LjRoot31]|uniref:ParB/RepB/Spo0J family partition protein n=1 Tax=Caballeronia sp. LjRoot31 TaxID=3342324 RepID=UPI003ECDB27E